MRTKHRACVLHPQQKDIAWEVTDGSRGIMELHPCGELMKTRPTEFSERKGLRWALEFELVGAEGAALLVPFGRRTCTWLVTGANTFY